MEINKWNEVTKEYEKYSIPDDWKVPIFSYDMEEKINCVCCGRPMLFCDGYTSLRFHTDHGMGYYECRNCYDSYMPTYLASKE